MENSSIAEKAHKKLGWAITSLYALATFSLLAIISTIALFIIFQGIFSDAPDFLIMSIVYGIGQILFFMFLFFLIKGLRNRKKWARIAGFVVALLSGVNTITIIASVFIFMALVDKHIVHEFQEGEIIQ